MMGILQKILKNIYIILIIYKFINHVSILINILTTASKNINYDYIFCLLWKKLMGFIFLKFKKMFILILALLYITAAKNCSTRSECTDVSDDWNYVDCISGECKCQPGFFGNASVTNKCQCSLPNVVYYINGTVYCANKYDAPYCTVQSSSICNSVSVDSNFVFCVNNKCQCSTKGFSGNGTIANKCKCVLPNTADHWKNNSVYCLNYDTAITMVNEAKLEDKQMSVVNQLLQALVYPEPKYIITAYKTNQSHPVFDLFTLDSKGRVVPVGVDLGMSGNIEYFFGFVADETTQIDKVTIIKMFSKGNKVYADYVLRLNSYNPLNLTQKINTYNLSQAGPFTMVVNEEGKVQISKSDLTIRYLGSAVYSASGGRGFGFGTLAYANSTCTTYFKSQEEGGAGCTPEMDPTGYYADHAECVYYHMSYLPGSLENIWMAPGGNTTACRYFHMKMAKVNPRLHCKHVGKNGSDKCINHDYKTFFDEEYK